MAEAMSLAAATGGSGPDLADLVNRYWRLVPDEDLGAAPPAQMLARRAGHLDLAAQRLPGRDEAAHRPARREPAPRS